MKTFFRRFAITITMLGVTLGLLSSADRIYRTHSSIYWYGKLQDNSLTEISEIKNTIGKVAQSDTPRWSSLLEALSFKVAPYASVFGSACIIGMALFWRDKKSHVQVAETTALIKTHPGKGVLIALLILSAILILYEQAEYSRTWIESLDFGTTVLNDDQNEKSLEQMEKEYDEMTNRFMSYTERKNHISYFQLFGYLMIGIVAWNLKRYLTKSAPAP